MSKMLNIFAPNIHSDVSWLNLWSRIRCLSLWRGWPPFVTQNSILSRPEFIYIKREKMCTNKYCVTDDRFESCRTVCPRCITLSPSHNSFKFFVLSKRFDYPPNDFSKKVSGVVEVNAYTFECWTSCLIRFQFSLEFIDSIVCSTRKTVAVKSIS